MVRLRKCNALHFLEGTVRLHVTRQVAEEFQAQGPNERAAFIRLGVTKHGIRLGTRVWELFCQLRGGEYSTRDLGEYESLAVALARAEEGEFLPFITYDRPATKQADDSRVVTLDFLDTLAWLVGCGVLTAPEADEIEGLASIEDGWKRPADYAGSIETVREARQAKVVERMTRWRATHER
jgi:hypothetical protein